MKRTAILCAILCACATTAQARPRTLETCEVTRPRAASAFIRRLARDAGNLLGELGTELELVPSVLLGMPIGAGGPEIARKVARLWHHTENKLGRKCTDADAATLFPGDGADVPAVTDDLFNHFGLPWIRALRELVAPHGAPCARRAIVQAGRQARDWLRWGIAPWDYLRNVDAACAPGVAGAILELIEAHLGALRR